MKDRVDLSGLSDEPPSLCKHAAEDLLPSPEDIASLKEDFRILVSRYNTIKLKYIIIGASLNSCLTTNVSLSQLYNIFHQDIARRWHQSPWW